MNNPTAQGKAKVKEMPDATQPSGDPPVMPADLLSYAYDYFTFRNRGHDVSARACADGFNHFVSRWLASIIVPPPAAPSWPDEVELSDCGVVQDIRGKVLATGHTGTTLDRLGYEIGGRTVQGDIWRKPGAAFPWETSPVATVADDEGLAAECLYFETTGDAYQRLFVRGVDAPFCKGVPLGITLSTEGMQRYIDKARNELASAFARVRADERRRCAAESVKP